jgi:hypothetical protein
MRCIINAKTAQAFLANVTNSLYKKNLRPTQEKCNHILEFSFNSCLPYLPHKEQLAYQSCTLIHHHQGRL